MSCCSPTIIPFTNSGGNTIAYSQSMRDKHGDIPNVEVYHLDSGEYILATVSIKIDGKPTSLITIDHGGSATGFIKIGK